MTAANFMQKAERALSSAQTLLDIGDAEGACNRAYYAMFDAAHAALLGFGAELPETSPKTHRGLIAAFGRHLVLGKHVAAEFGASLNKVERLRTLADYTGDPIGANDAAWAVGQAEMFVAAMKASLAR